MESKWSTSMNCDNSSCISTFEPSLKSLGTMKHVPKKLYYKGNLSLLERPKIAIVGSRKPITYTKTQTYSIAQTLAYAGLCIVSGGAMGVDALAHQGAGFANTVMVAGTGLDKRYPTINASLIQSIEEEGLVLSQFETGEPSFKWNFPLRNELIVALGEVLIVTQADLKSGTMHSVDFAKEMGKPIYVLPHRLGESEGTTLLLKQGVAKPLFDVETLLLDLGYTKAPCSDTFLNYCDSSPLYHEAVEHFGDKVFEYECLGKIRVEKGRLKRL
jgi:DNA processing protein